MPFTLSHVAAVIPAHRVLSRAGLFSAAVIGSMVPDFGMLLPSSLARWQTHSLAALFSFCLPVGLLAYLITLLIIKPAVLEIVPDGAYARLRTAHSTLSPLSVRSWLYAGLAILLGAVTHLIWDAFTHENARGVRMFPVLEGFGPEVDGHPVQLFRWLQYGSSVVGLLVVIGALLMWLHHVPPLAQRLQIPPRPLASRERLAWTGLYLALPLLAAATGCWRLHTPKLASLPVGWKIEVVAVDGMRGICVSLVLVSLLLLARRSLLHRATPA